MSENVKYTNSKRYRAAVEKRSGEALSTVAQAVEFAKQTATAKFDESIDVAVNLNIDVRHADQNVRRMVALPHGTGKSVKVACIVSDDLLDDAKASGADIVGGQDVIDEIKKGNIEFEKIVANPAMMPKLGAVAKILGPKGLMPNPKLGTVTNDVKSAVDALKAGQVELKAEKNGVIHATIGRSSFDVAKLAENFSAIIGELSDAKPKAVKGVYCKSIHLSASMGPSVSVDVKDAKIA